MLSLGEVLVLIDYRRHTPTLHLPQAANDTAGSVHSSVAMNQNWMISLVQQIIENLLNNTLLDYFERFLLPLHWSSQIARIKKQRRGEDIR